MCPYGANDEVRFAGGDALPVSLLQHVERYVALALAIGEVGRPHFPVVDQVVVFVAVRGKSVAEGMFGLLLWLERVAEQVLLLAQRGTERFFLFAGLLRGLGEELYAALIGPDYDVQIEF